MKHCHGLTGGIGCGKSTVATLFSELGARIVDTDQIAHRLTQTGGAALPSIRKEFGDGLIDSSGAMDRTKMRQLVFADGTAKRRLESILHPLIREESKMIATSASDAPYTIVVVPLLFESGRYQDWLHSSIAVDCTEEQQILRTMQRSKLSEAEVRAIMAQQLSRNERLKLADAVIENDGRLDELRLQVEELHSRLIRL
ncbi:MAG: dephospho-CoA kinase [Sideroxydans sp.]